jgi:hypothetical protein
MYVVCSESFGTFEIARQLDVVSYPWTLYGLATDGAVKDDTCSTVSAVFAVLTKTPAASETLGIKW